MNPSSPLPSLPSDNTSGYSKASMNPTSLSLFSYTTSAYSDASMNSPSPSLFSYTTSAYSKTSMNPPSPSLFSYTTSAYSGANKSPPSSPSLLNMCLQWSQEEPEVLLLPTQLVPTVKPARTRRPPPPFSTCAYSEASKNPPSIPSLLNLSLQWSQQEPGVLPLPTQPQPTVKPARTRRPT